MTRLLTFILLSLFLALPLTAAAQDDGSPEVFTYDPTGTGSVNSTAEHIRQMKQQSQVDKGYIKPQVVHVSIIHPDYLEADQFALQMAVPDVVSGCYELTPLEYEANFIDPYFLDIKVKRYRRIAPEGAAATSACNRQNRQSTGMMVLSKADLLKRGTQEIRFSTEAGTDIYRIQLNDALLELVPESMVIFKAQNMGGELKDRIVYNFTGDRMVSLQVPMARPGDNIHGPLLQFATQRAMTPATNQTPAPSGQNAPVYYFYDEGGHVAGNIGPDGFGEIGKITVIRPYDGENGRTGTPVELSVFVTRPGTQL